MARLPQKSLDQQDFLKLLVVQMTTQDPLSPKTDAEFLGQMATFASLEQTRTLVQDLGILRADQELMKANALIGRAVEVDLDEKTRAFGIVTGVEMRQGRPMVIVGGERYDLGQLHEITLPVDPVEIENLAQSN
jgi:flagellar basal-body rod modification protein FlgD